MSVESQCQFDSTCTSSSVVLVSLSKRLGKEGPQVLNDDLVIQLHVEVIGQ